MTLSGCDGDHMTSSDRASDYACGRCSVASGCRDPQRHRQREACHPYKEVVNSHYSLQKSCDSALFLSSHSVDQYSDLTLVNTV